MQDPLDSGQLPEPSATGDGAGRRRPRRSLLVVAVAVAAVVGLVTLGVRISGGEAPSRCLSGLAGRTPAPDGLAMGSDLGRARSLVGATDESGHDAWQLWAESGVLLDPASSQTVAMTFDTAADEIGYEWSDVHCWTGATVDFVAEGSFDPERVAETPWGAAGVMTVDGDVLELMSSDDSSNDTRASSTLTALIEELDRNDVVSFTATSNSAAEADRVWVANGIALGDRHDLLMVWAFPDESEAAFGEPSVREVLREESAVGELIEGDPADLLDRRGAMLVLRAPMTVDTDGWYTPRTTMDPAMMVFMG